MVFDFEQVNMSFPNKEILGNQYFARRDKASNNESDERGGEGRFTLEATGVGNK